MNLDILLVHPGGVHGIDPVYGELSRSLTSIEPPLWPRLIAGYLQSRDHSVEIIDMEAERRSASQVAAYVKHARPKIVAICVHGHQPSASTQQMVNARVVAQAIDKFKNADGWSEPPHIVMLGNHPSALPAKTLGEEPVDFVIDGEGPITLDLLLKGLPAQDIPGLVYWSDEERDTIKRNPPAPLLPMDELHGDVWNLLPHPRYYRAHAWQCLDGSPRTPYAAIHTSLGCPFACEFCMINVFQHANRYRTRAPNQVVDEIQYLYDQGVRTFKIIDELFVLKRDHYTAICQGLIDSGLGEDINIWAYSRTDTVTTSDLPLLRQAGVKWLALGIESGSQDVRDASRKKVRSDDDANAAIRNVVRDIQQADINVIGNYIFGLPDDTHATMQQTLDLALELNTEFANFYCAMAYPGSALYDRIAATSPQDLPPSWAAYSQHNRHTYPLRTASLSPREILAFRDKAFKTYFTSANYQAYIRRRFGYAAVEHVNQMLTFELKRDLLQC